MTATPSPSQIVSNDEFVAYSSSASPYVNIFRRNAGDVFSKLSNPATLPSGASPTNYGHFNFSKYGNYLAQPSNTSPFVTVYKNDYSGTFTKLANPSQLPATGGIAAEFVDSPMVGDNLLFTGGSASPWVRVYNVDTSNDLITHKGDSYFGAIPNTVNDIAGSPDGQYIVTAHVSTGTNPLRGITGYAFTNAATGYTTPLTFSASPTSTAHCATFTRDGAYLLVGGSASPYIHVYANNGNGTFTAQANPSQLPTNDVWDIGVSPDDNYIIVGQGASTPYHVVYKNNKNGTLTKLANLTPSPAAGVTGVAWSPDGKFVALTTNAATFVYRNNNDDTFTQVTDSNLGTGVASSIRGITWSPTAAPFPTPTATVTPTPTTTPTMSPSITPSPSPPVVGINVVSIDTTEKNSIYGVTYSPQRSEFAALAFDGTSRAMRSDNGTSWSLSTAPDAQWFNITWSPALSLYVAVRYNLTTTTIATSPDAVTWTVRTVSSSIQSAVWTDIAWSPELGLFCAVAQSGTWRAITSPDGINWTERAIPTTGTGWRTIEWIPEKGMFVAGGGANITTSTNGITWTSAVTVPSMNNLEDIAYSPSLNRFVAIAGSGTTLAATSPDAVTWTARTIPAATNAVIWIPEYSNFIAVGAGGYVGKSGDGITWTTVSTPTTGTANLTEIVWSPDDQCFIIVAASGTYRVFRGTKV